MIIDVHSHAIPKEMLNLYKEQPMRYGLGIPDRTDGEKLILTADGVSFPLYDAFWNIECRLRDMEQRGVNAEVLTPVPNTLPYDLPVDDAIYAAKVLNDGIAAMCREEPEKFIPGAILPMQDVPAACEELERVARKLGVRVIQLNTQVNGRYYDEPEFLPFFAACERLGVLVFFHPLHNNMNYGLNPYYLINLLGNPIDTTISAVRLVLGGIPERYPDCRFLFAHGGGFLPYQQGRIAHGFTVRKETSVVLKNKLPDYYFSQLYYDTVTHSPEALEYLIKKQGADHVMLGSDYPFDMADVRDPLQVLDLTEMNSDMKKKILSQNLCTLLNIFN